MYTAIGRTQPAMCTRPFTSSHAGGTTHATASPWPPSALAPGPEPRCRLLVDLVERSLLVHDPDANGIERTRRLAAHEAVDNVLENPLGRPCLRILPAAATAFPEADHGPLSRLDARAHDPDLALFGSTPVVD